MNDYCAAVLLVCSLLYGSARTAECPLKGCVCGQTVIMCNDLGLTAMPQKTIKGNTYFTTLQFDRNNITTVTGDSLPANLSDISFVVNPITTIEDGAFDESVNTLTSLSFSNAHFTQLPDAFQRLNVLNFLTISDSVVEDWNESAMKHIGPVLGTLAIDNVAFSAWPSWLQNFSNLTDLSIDSAAISEIPDDGLNSISSTLKFLTLNNNSLDEVPKAISKMTALHLLALDRNKIVDVSWLPQNCKLDSLTLSNNRIHDSQQLTAVISTHASSLVQLELHSNQLTSFPDLAIFTLVSELDFRHNRLVDSNSGSLPPGLSQLQLGSNKLPRLPRFLSTMNSVTQLYISSNSITALEDIGFPRHTHGAELQNNKISRITDNSFPQNASITYILLNNNPLVSISEAAFRNLPHLVELQVQNTKITRLPLALSYLTHMDEFDITNTTTLVCTCLEKPLLAWVLNFRLGMIKGTCGETSIYYFYNVLSRNCPDTL